MTLIVLAGVLGLTSWAWNERGQDWWSRFERNAEPWVAIGTILLALATFVLARRSQQEVSASAKQTEAALQEVELSRRALQAGARPLLVDAPLDVYMEADSETMGLLQDRPTMIDRGRPTARGGVSSRKDEPVGYIDCTIPMQNVGAGVALIQSFAIQWQPWRGPWNARGQQTVVPPDQVTRFYFSAEVDPGDASMLRDELQGGFATERIEVDVVYTDIDGEQQTRTHAEIEEDVPVAVDFR